MHSLSDRLARDKRAAILPNHAACTVLTFWRDDDGVLQHERRPVIGWRVASDPDEQALPITPGYPLNPEEVWCLETPGSTSTEPGGTKLWLFGDDCTCGTLEGAMRHARAEQDRRDDQAAARRAQEQRDRDQAAASAARSLAAISGRAWRDD